eukprot:3230526-Pleurochrysis_carterae.AAC.1
MSFATDSFFETLTYATYPRAYDHRQPDFSQQRGGVTDGRAFPKGVDLYMGTSFTAEADFWSFPATSSSSLHADIFTTIHDTRQLPQALWADQNEELRDILAQPELPEVLLSLRFASQSYQQLSGQSLLRTVDIGGDAIALGAHIPYPDKALQKSGNARPEAMPVHLDTNAGDFLDTNAGDFLDTSFSADAMFSFVTAASANSVWFMPEIFPEAALRPLIDKPAPQAKLNPLVREGRFLDYLDGAGFGFSLPGGVTSNPELFGSMSSIAATTFDGLKVLPNLPGPVGDELTALVAHPAGLLRNGQFLDFSDSTELDSSLPAGGMSQIALIGS